MQEEAIALRVVKQLNQCWEDEGVLCRLRQKPDSAEYYPVKVMGVVADQLISSHANWLPLLCAEPNVHISPLVLELWETLR